MTKPPTSDAAGAVLPEGFSLVAVKGLTSLCDALERAYRKGYMPDAMVEEWEAFDWRATPQPQPEQAESVEVPELSVSMCSSSQYAKGWNDCRAAMIAAAPQPTTKKGQP